LPFESSNVTVTVPLTEDPSEVRKTENVSLFSEAIENPYGLPDVESEHCPVEGFVAQI
jgi:hypothetical protein